jgi:glycosyltransferase involved in cell wall biosynthesis
MWDYLAATRVDRFIANSNNTAARISKYYRRSSTVITPGIADAEFTIGNTECKNAPFIAVGRVIPLKRFDLMVEAFNINGLPLVIITDTEWSFVESLKNQSNSNITWISGVTDIQKIKQLQQAKALIFPCEDDFGMVPIEAMLCGTPVIAYGRGGALETIKAWVSGIFFDEPTADSLVQATTRFNPKDFSPQEVREHAMRFTKTVFKQKISEYIQKEFELFKKSSTIYHIEK